MPLAKSKINIYWDAGKKGAILSDQKLPGFEPLNNSDLYYKKYDNIYKLETNTLDYKYYRINIFSFENAGAFRKTSANLNRQVGYLVYYLTQLIESKELKIKVFNEAKVYKSVINGAKIGQDRKTKKELTLKQYISLDPNIDEHTADALMLHDYIIDL